MIADYMLLRLVIAAIVILVASVLALSVKLVSRIVRSAAHKKSVKAYSWDRSKTVARSRSGLHICFPHLVREPGHKPVFRLSVFVSGESVQPILPKTAPKTRTSRVTPQNRYFAIG